MFNSNVQKFFAQNKEKVASGLEEIGKVLVEDIKVATPVRTGHLRDSNSYSVDKEGGKLYLINSAEYAAFVELGTVYQVAQPFIRETMFKDISKITEIMKKNLETK